MDTSHNSERSPSDQEAPREQAFLDALTNESSAFLNDLLGQKRFLDHQRQIIEQFENHPPYDKLWLKMVSPVHGIVDYGLLNPVGETDEEKQETQLKAKEIINGWFEQCSNEESTYLRYAIGVSLSALYVERIAEGWRQGVGVVLEEHDEKGTPSFDLEAVKAQSGSDLDTKTIAEQLRAAVTKDFSKVEEGEIDEELLKAFQPQLSEPLARLIRGFKDYDLEAILFEAIKIDDNIANPPSGSPTSSWRSAIEQASIYTQFLDILGGDLSDFAAELRGGALEVLVLDQEALKLAKEFRAQCEAAEPVISWLVEATTKFALEEISGGKKISGEISNNLKSTGSTATKLAENETYLNVDSVDDGVRYRIVISGDEGTAEEFAEQFLGMLAHPPGEDGYLRIAHEVEWKQKQSGYRAIHINCNAEDLAERFRGGEFTDGSEQELVTFEVQIVTVEQHRNNTFGPGSHVQYKAGEVEGLESLGERNDILREGMEEPIPNPQSATRVDILLAMMDLGQYANSDELDTTEMLIAYQQLLEIWPDVALIPNLELTS
jgi:hypothetical protein